MWRAPGLAPYGLYTGGGSCVATLGAPTDPACAHSRTRAIPSPPPGVVAAAGLNATAGLTTAVGLGAAPGLSSATESE